jgi:hypothetical protein
MAGEPKGLRLPEDLEREIEREKERRESPSQRR